MKEMVKKMKIKNKRISKELKNKRQKQKRTGK